MITHKLKRLSFGAALCAVLAVMLTLSVTQPARADDRDWRSHERYVVHHRYHRRPVVVHDVYAPPLVVSPPPPAYYYGPPQPVYAEPAEPSFNFIIPLHIH